MTNDLRHSIYTRDTEGNDLTISIRLNDECKNGRQEFSITADSKKGRYGGCCHDEILAVKPELKPFVALHLSDASGVPMYAIENGFYHLTNGFNNTKPDDEKFAQEFCDYYRVTPEQFAFLTNSETSTQFAMNIEKLGILEQWKAEAEASIKTLEEMTGETFVNDSVKSNYHALTQERIDAENLKIASDYTPEAKAQREADKVQAQFDKLEADKNKKIAEVTVECELKQQVLVIGGKDALEASIIYTHSKELAFNWSSLHLVGQDVVDAISKQINLPEGYTIKNKG